MASAQIGFDVCRSDVPAVKATSQRLLDLFEGKGLTLLQAYGTCYRGWARARQGQADEGIAQMRAGLAALRAAGTIGGLLFLTALLAEAHLCAGQPEEGLRIVDEALAERFEARLSVAEMHRLRSELFQAQGQEAKKCFRQAIEVACQQQAKSWELRATMSLARLWQVQGRGPEARQILAEIYAWFTEGFDTPDLVAAQALLDQLGARRET